MPRLICDDRKFKKLVKWKPLCSINDIIDDTLIIEVLCKTI